MLVRSRRLGAFALIALMIAAFALVAFARLPGLLPGGSTGSGTQPVTTAEATSGQPGGEATPSPATPGPSDGGGAASPTAPEPSPTGSVEAATATPAISPPSPTPIPSLTAAPSPQPTATTQTYVVQRGDTLSSIARQFDTTVDAIAAANGIANPSLIRPGQELIIP